MAKWGSFSRDEKEKKRKARLHLNNALRDGEVVKGPCEVGKNCKGRIEGHHENYDEPLKARWFCVRHHRSVLKVV